MRLSNSLESIKGIGPKATAQFHAAGLRTVDDLINFLPRRHEDYTNVVAIDDISPGKKTIRATCESISTRVVRRGLRVTTATLADATGRLRAVWFNQPYRASQLSGGEEFFFSGEFEFRGGRYQLTNPSAECVSDMPIQTDRLLPIYRVVKGLKNQLVRKALMELKPFITMLDETLPQSIVQHEQLLGRAEAINAMHFPQMLSDVTQARERLAYEELFQLLLASQLNRQANARLRGYHIPFEQATIKRFVSSLPFDLTGAQRRAAWDILQDFERAIPMNRLLQGDVGSGKTVVAGLAAFQVVSHGYQAAVMAPTELLASQHAETLTQMLRPFGITVVLATGSVKGRARTKLYQTIASGDAQVIVGTHALIQQQVTFHKLGFVAIDEQHRFGVEQRQKLLAKGDMLPHLLAMTATPIPRSLALTVYGELDVSVVDELPAGRQPIITKIISPNSTAAIYQEIDQHISQGRQVYVVCGLIDDDPTTEVKSVQAEYRRLKTTIFSHCSIGLLHGKLKPDEKDAIMSQFKSRAFNILVSTTVIEVGVDVPNATIMMIENADRFGLSQLHQLRGRVGRGEYQSYCYLMMSDSAKPSQRLRELEKSQDGFYLAEVDLRLRGPGEIYGRSQHGTFNLQIATFGDAKLIARAQNAAKLFVNSGQALTDYPTLQAKVAHYQRLTTLN